MGFKVNLDYPRVCIVVHNYNGGDHLKNFLNSCRSLTYQNLHVIVVDNGSRDNSFGVVRCFPETTLIRLSRNCGVEALNVGIRSAISDGAKYVFVSDNDTALESGSITILVETMEKQCDIGIAAPVTFKMRNPREVDKQGFGALMDLRTGDLIEARPPASLGSNSIDVDAVGASMIRVDVLQRVGLYDNIYFLYTTDNDLCARVKLAGYKIIVCPRAKLWHAGSSTTRTVSGFKSYYFTANRLIFLRKHGIRKGASLTPLSLVRSVIHGTGTEALKNSSPASVIKALIFGSLGAMSGFTYYSRGVYPDILWARRLLLSLLDKNQALPPTSS